MAIYEIYASNNPELTRFVRDKNSIIALIFPAIWLAWNRLWFGLAIYLTIAFFFFAISTTSWAVIAGAFSFIPGLYLFLEGSNLLASKHQGSGLNFKGVIEADSFESAELKWFSKPENCEVAEVAQVQVPLAHVPAQKSVSEKADFGLFAEE